MYHYFIHHLLDTHRQPLQITCRIPIISRCILISKMYNMKRMFILELMKYGSSRVNMYKLRHLNKTKMLYSKKGNNKSTHLFKLF